MRKKIIPALGFAAVVGIVFAICILITNQVHTMDIRGPVPEGIRRETYMLLGWKECVGRDIPLQFPQSPEETAYAIVLCEMNAYRLYCNGELVAEYGGQLGYERIHIVPLTVSGDAACTIYLEVPAIGPRNRIMLSSLERAERYLGMANGANMLTIGVYALVAFYGITLFWQKRSERYLLYIVVLSLTALASALSNSTIAYDGVFNIDQPVRYFRVTFCAAICFPLMEVRLPGKWSFIYSWQGVLTFTALLYLLYMVNMENVASELSYLLILPTAFACADGYARGMPCAAPFMVFAATREALRIYYRIITDGLIVSAPFFSYFYMPQLSSLLFVLGCILVINERFARKFRQTDELAVKLEEANATLDAKVAQRTLELQLSNERLVHEQERKHNIMTNIFHDLRTPIFSAMGSAESIKAADVESELKLAILRDRLDFLEHLSEQLFFLAKLEDGNIRFENYRIRVDEFFPRIAAGFEPVAQQKGLDFVYVHDSGMLITGDSYRLKQALDNLLSNAAKYTLKGGIRFYARREGAEAAFHVEDTGVGIAREDLPYIFDRYYQGKLVRGPESGGLGLSIARAIVDAHGGSLLVESEEGKGAHFILKIALET